MARHDAGKLRAPAPRMYPPPKGRFFPINIQKNQRKYNLVSISSSMLRRAGYSRQRRAAGGHPLVPEHPLAGYSRQRRADGVDLTGAHVHVESASAAPQSGSTTAGNSIYIRPVTPPVRPPIPPIGEGWAWLFPIAPSSPPNSVPGTICVPCVFCAIALSGCRRIRANHPPQWSK
jgi:hypothetical protein